MSDDKALHKQIAAVHDKVAEIEAKANLLGTALRLANERADAAEAREAELRDAAERVVNAEVVLDSHDENGARVWDAAMNHLTDVLVAREGTETVPAGKEGA